jgi:hypothetical protein
MSFMKGTTSNMSKTTNLLRGAISLYKFCLMICIASTLNVTAALAEEVPLTLDLNVLDNLKLQCSTQYQQCMRSVTLRRDQCDQVAFGQQNLNLRQIMLDRCDKAYNDQAAQCDKELSACAKVENSSCTRSCVVQFGNVKSYGEFTTGPCTVCGDACMLVVMTTTGDAVPMKGTIDCKGKPQIFAPPAL